MAMIGHHTGLSLAILPLFFGSTRYIGIYYLLYYVLVHVVLVVHSTYVNIQHPDIDIYLSSTMQCENATVTVVVAFHIPYPELSSCSGGSRLKARLPLQEPQFLLGTKTKEVDSQSISIMATTSIHIQFCGC